MDAHRASARATFGATLSRPYQVLLSGRAINHGARSGTPRAAGRPASLSPLSLGWPSKTVGEMRHFGRLPNAPAKARGRTTFGLPARRKQRQRPTAPNQLSACSLTGRPISQRANWVNTRPACLSAFYCAHFCSPPLSQSRALSLSLSLSSRLSVGERAKPPIGSAIDWRHRRPEMGRDKPDVWAKLVSFRSLLEKCSFSRSPSAASSRQRPAELAHQLLSPPRHRSLDGAPSCARCLFEARQFGQFGRERGQQLGRRSLPIDYSFCSLTHFSQFSAKEGRPNCLQARWCVVFRPKRRTTRRLDGSWRANAHVHWLGTCERLQGD